jgi:hypothetical protein
VEVVSRNRGVTTFIATGGDFCASAARPSADRAQAHRAGEQRRVRLARHGHPGQRRDALEQLAGNSTASNS